MVELVVQGHCTTWTGIALLSCQCNALLSGALVLYLVHRLPMWCNALPGWNRCHLCSGKTWVFRVLRARIGDGGFIGQLGEASSGAVGFTGQLGGGSSGGCGFMWPT